MASTLPKCFKSWSRRLRPIPLMPSSAEAVATFERSER